VSPREHIVGLLPPELLVVRVVPLGTGKPLRINVRVVPLAIARLVERNVLPPAGTGRQAHVQELRLHEVPPVGATARVL
jgi:hypothetical protein